MTIEIKDYKPIQNSKCKGRFTLVLHKTGFEFRDCVWFESDGKKWFTFPSKEYESEGKKKFFPLIALINTNFREELNKSVLAALGLFFEKHPEFSPYIQKEPQKQMDMFQESDIPF